MLCSLSLLAVCEPPVEGSRPRPSQFVVVFLFWVKVVV